MLNEYNTSLIMELCKLSRRLSEVDKLYLKRVIIFNFLKKYSHISYINLFLRNISANSKNKYSYDHLVCELGYSKLFILYYFIFETIKNGREINYKKDVFKLDLLLSIYEYKLNKYREEIIMDRNTSPIFEKLASYSKINSGEENSLEDLDTIKKNLMNDRGVSEIAKDILNLVDDYSIEDIEDIIRGGLKSNIKLANEYFFIASCLKNKKGFSISDIVNLDHERF